MKRCKKRKGARATTSASNINEIEEDDVEPKETQKSTGVSVLDLPSLVVVEILSRLPIKTIFHCRCVCKTWLNLLSDPYFANLHLTRPPFISILLSIKNIFYLLELGGDYTYTRRPNTPKRFNPKFNLPINGLQLVGSCNGLLCLRDGSFSESIYVSNPLLGEYFALPKPRRDEEDFQVGYDFGFSPVTGHYKVIRLVFRWVRSETELGSFYSKLVLNVYTIGTNKWRNLGDAAFLQWGNSHGISLNGAVHWMTKTLEGFPAIYSFDIGEEQARPIPLPPELETVTSCWRLGVLGERLCMFDNLRLGCLELWSMKEYGVAESWTKDFVLRTSVESGLQNCLLQLVTLWKEGEILISTHSGSLISYNPRKGDFTELKVFGVKSKCLGVVNFQAVSYVPSFLSLTNVAMGERSRIVKIGR